MNTSSKYKTAAIIAAAFIVLFSATLTCGMDAPNVCESQTASATYAQKHRDMPQLHMSALDGVIKSNRRALAAKTTETPPAKQAPETDAVFSDVAVYAPAVLLCDMSGGIAQKLTLEQYVLGALLAEMPYDFCAEALCAQAIACRTYALYNLLNGSRHENGASVCTNAGHCQAYCDPATVSAQRLEAAKKAVENTSGEIMLYGGKPILAAFHSSSGKKTKSSAEVWGGDLAYLVSVETHENAFEDMPTVKTHTLALEDFAASMRRIKAFADISDSGFETVELKKSPSGRVMQVCIGTAQALGSDVVSVLGLRSCDFDIYVNAGAVTVICNGYGHGVGLSQYGAEEMARRGKNRYEILSHYYTGITFGKVAA